jgi:hypothetical protein
MMIRENKNKVLALIKRSEKYFYWYVLYKDKNYFERFLNTSKRIKRLINIS